jgi:hypothetical protein
MGGASIYFQAAKEVTAPPVRAKAALTSPGTQSISKRRARRAGSGNFSAARRSPAEN